MKNTNRTVSLNINLSIDLGQVPLLNNTFTSLQQDRPIRTYYLYTMYTSLAITAEAHHKSKHRDKPNDKIHNT